jgi:UDP:flavonoid glycosyltransferase YjiC (YdhE family)
MNLRSTFLLSVAKENWSRVRSLVGVSPSILSKPRDWGENIDITGFWFLKEGRYDEPRSELVDFLDSGPPPVSIGFGSMMGREPEVFTRKVLSALQRSGQRGILISGWGGLSSKDLPDYVIQVDHVSHDWLFPRVAAVVCHGGIGTVSAALQAGSPVVSVPFFVDQGFWAHRLFTRGVSPEPQPAWSLSVDSLSAAIQSATSDQRLRESCMRLGEQIRAEDGVAKAVKIIDTELRDQRR